MADKFQDIRHKHSTYDRPNEDWVCGGKCTGCPCFLGPDRSGRCRAGTIFDGRRSGECLPRRTGGRWLCTRSETHGGESCVNGPLPDGSCCQNVPQCQPQPTLRRLRGMVTMVIAVLTVAALCVMLGRESPEDLRGAAALSPGPLSSSHSALENKCNQCHSDMNVGPSRLLDMHASRFDHRGVADSKLCLDCHQEIGGSGGRYAFGPHTMDPEKLRAKAAGKSKPDPLLRLASFLVKDSASGNKELACGTCHQEHHGLEGDLKTFTNRQCQICHQQQFESFSHGHPEFTSLSYPANRRTRINFDHVGHYSLHFAEKAKEAPGTVPAGFNSKGPHTESVTCASCHASSGADGRMNVVSFEKACASCHENDTLSGNKLPVIGYPLLDTPSLDSILASGANPRSIGAWPADAPNDFPWLLLYLLPEDVRSSWQRLAENKIYMHDLSALPPEFAGDAERVSWGIKELFRDLCCNSQSETPSGEVGQDELIRRLRLAGCDQDGASLINGLPPDAFDMFRNFMGPEMCMKVMKEVDDYRSKKFPAPTKPKLPAPEIKPSAPAAGGTENFGAPPQEESFGAPVPKAAPASASESFAPPAAETFSAAPAPGGENFGAAPSPTASSESFSAPVAAISGAGTAVHEVHRLEPVDRETWAGAGGWHQQFGVIYYKSTGHADPLLKAWIEHVLEDVKDPLRLATLREGFGFQLGTLSQATGHCLKCHTIDERRDAEGKLVGALINWHSYGKKTAVDDDRPLTHFNHMSHLLFANCRQCHTTNQAPGAAEKYAAAFPGDDSWDMETKWFKQADATQYHSNFEQISKSTCADCHTAKKSGDNCLQCHSYHHPAPDGAADMLKWLRFRESRPSRDMPKVESPATAASGKNVD